MRRRELLAAAPVAGFAALPAGALAVRAGTETPVARMHREIIRLRDLVNDDRTLTDDQSDRMCAEMFALANRIVDLPARDLADMMLKFMGHTIDGDHETGECPDSNRLWAEARALIGGEA